MDIILLFLAESLDKHGITLVHVIYPPLLDEVISIAIYSSFKRTVHNGNSKHKRLLLDACQLIFCSIASAFVCTLPVLKSALRSQAFSFKIAWVQSSLERSAIEGKRLVHKAKYYSNDNVNAQSTIVKMLQRNILNLQGITCNDFSWQRLTVLPWQRCC